MSMSNLVTLRTVCSEASAQGSGAPAHSVPVGSRASAGIVAAVAPGPGDGADDGGAEVEGNTTLPSTLVPDEVVLPPSFAHAASRTTTAQHSTSNERRAGSRVVASRSARAGW